MGILIIFTIYQLIQILGLPLIAIYLCIRPVRGKPTFGNFIQRMGFIPKLADNKNVFWLHAVSVGEALSIQGLIQKIKRDIPDAICYVTTGTITGRKIAKENLNADYVSLMPFDLLPPMLLALKRINPKAIIIVEAELWPNLLMLTHFKKIPTYSINARISKRSYTGYKILKPFISPLLNTFKKLYTQTTEDELRFERLGVNPAKFVPLGNLKTPNVLEKFNAIKNTLIKNTNPIILVGSIHPGELKIYLSLYKMLKKETPNLKLILAPRHFNWKNILIKNIQALKFKYILWDEKYCFTSTLEEEAQQTLDNVDILLVCRLGILFKLYNMTTVFCLGGTFIPIGGHNLLEAAVWSKVSIIGPHYFNCKLIANQLETANGLIKVNNEKELIRKTRFLIRNAHVANNMGINAKNWLDLEALNVQDKINLLVKELTSLALLNLKW